jgi:hypothetical protein
MFDKCLALAAIQAAIFISGISQENILASE